MPFFCDILPIFGWSSERISFQEIGPRKDKDFLLKYKPMSYDVTLHDFLKLICPSLVVAPREVVAGEQNILLWVSFAVRHRLA